MSMRILETLVGQKLTDSSYTFDTTYNTVLLRSQLEANTRITAEGTVSTPQTNYDAGTTLNFIFPFFYMYNTVLDGIARGNIRMRFYFLASGGTYIYGKATINLYSITPGGVKTTLGTVTTNEILIIATNSLDTAVDIPFFMNLTNQTVAITDRIMLSITYFGKWTGTQSQVYWEGALNSNNVFIELPILAET